MENDDFGFIREILPNFERDNPAASPYQLSTYNCCPAFEGKQSHKGKSYKGIFAFLKNLKKARK